LGAETLATIEVDFDVYKELTNRRTSETVTYNDVIRELLELKGCRDAAAIAVGLGGWMAKGVVFPNGTEFRATYKGKVYSARVENNQLLLNGMGMKSPSEASHVVTGNNVNGWRFWKCKLPGSSVWRRLDTLRNN
jgi:hypothetical protein